MSLLAMPLHGPIKNHKDSISAQSQSTGIWLQMNILRHINTRLGMIMAYSSASSTYNRSFMSFFSSPTYQFTNEIQTQKKTHALNFVTNLATKTYYLIQVKF